MILAFIYGAVILFYACAAFTAFLAIGFTLWGAFYVLKGVVYVLRSIAKPLIK